MPTISNLVYKNATYIAEKALNITSNVANRTVENVKGGKDGEVPELVKWITYGLVSIFVVLIFLSISICDDSKSKYLCSSCEPGDVHTYRRRQQNSIELQEYTKFSVGKSVGT